MFDNKIGTKCVNSEFGVIFTPEKEFFLLPVLELKLLRNGVTCTPYSGVILTPKRSLKNSFSGVKVTPDIEELK